MNNDECAACSTVARITSTRAIFLRNDRFAEQSARTHNIAARRMRADEEVSVTIAESFGAIPSLATRLRADKDMMAIAARRLRELSHVDSSSTAITQFSVDFFNIH